METLLRKKIIWQNHSSNARYHYTFEDGRLIYLRLNNFPDEPLYTLISGLEIIDLEDKPQDWIVT
jgi:hypothetical protein